MSTRPVVVLATSNPGKVREFQELLAEEPILLRAATPEELAVLPDEGDEYEANAIMKATGVAAAAGLPALADDSGLEVAGLDGAPGPRSARYGGPGLDDAGRVAHLLDELAARPGADRGARFVCVAVLAWPDGRHDVARGVCEGRILSEPAGSGGFGYDPVFLAEGETVSVAELPEARKNELSHRGRALRALGEAWRSLDPAPAG